MDAQETAESQVAPVIAHLRELAEARVAVLPSDLNGSGITYYNLRDKSRKLTREQADVVARASGVIRDFLLDTDLITACAKLRVMGYLLSLEVVGDNLTLFIDDLRDFESMRRLGLPEPIVRGTYSVDVSGDAPQLALLRPRNDD